MIIDVKYMHAFRSSNLIYQPRMAAIRDDLQPEACTLSQLRYKGTECDLNQFFAAAGTNYLPQVQSKPRDFASDLVHDSGFGTIKLPEVQIGT
jgi:hypothetical protein